MPTKKPRVNLVLDEDFNAILNRISSVSGCSKASILMEVLLPAKSHFEEVASLLEEVVERKNSPLRDLQYQLDAVMERLMSSNPEFNPRARSLMIDLVHELEGAKASAPVL